MKTFAEKNWGNCEKAIGYCLNFVQISYIYGQRSDYYEIVCPGCSANDIQIKDYICRKSDCSEKDYYQLSFGGMGVSKKLKRDMVDFGVGEENFRPITTPRGDLIGFQITPVSECEMDLSKNGMRSCNACEDCGKMRYEVIEKIYPTLAYGGLGYPVFFSTEISTPITYDTITQDIYISLDLYHSLLAKYPRLECRPIFNGTILDDAEYQRLTSANNRLESYKETLLKENDANLRLALLNAAFPVNESWQIEPSIRSFFQNQPGLCEAIIGSYFTSIEGNATDDIYLPYLKREYGHWSPKVKAIIVFLDALHDYAFKGTISKRQLQDYKTKAMSQNDMEKPFDRLEKVISGELADNAWEDRLQQFEENMYPQLNVLSNPWSFIEYVLLQ